MVTAFVLINCELGNEENVIKHLKTIKTVKNVQGIMGAYDMIVKVEAENVIDIRNSVAGSIRSIPKILSTLTLMAT